MNKMKQFWSLFKFQTGLTPFFWFMPLIFGMNILLPFLTGLHTGDYHPSLSSFFFNNQNLLFVGIFGSMILAPEKFQFGAANAMGNSHGNEFLLTRAIDRPILYRAKTALLYVMVLLLPSFAVLYSLKDPDLVVNEYSKTAQQQCLESVPGSKLLPVGKERSLPSVIVLPRGNVLIAEWQLWALVMAAILLQILITTLYPFKYGKFLLWAIYFGFIVLPMFDLANLGKNLPTVSERLFFSWAAHPFLFWISSAAALILVQLACEKRFARIEQ